MSFPSFVRLLLLSGAFCLSPSARSEYLPPDQMPGGWKSHEIPGGRYSRLLATSDTLLALTVDSQESLQPQKIVVFRTADFSIVASMDKPADFPAYGTWAKAGGFVNGRLVVVSTVKGVRIDELDTASGTWTRSAVDADFTGGAGSYFSGECGDPAVFRNEIRVKCDDTRIRRWNPADWSPLPTLAEGYSSSSTYELKPKVFGTLWVKYRSDTTIALENSSGLPVNLAAPKNRPMDAFTTLAASESYLAATTVMKERGILVWKSGNPAAPPRFIPEECQYPVIWKNRYLIGVSRMDYQNVFKIWDLARPAPAGMLLDVPRVFSIYQFAAAGDDLVFPHASLEQARVCNLPLPPNSQLTRITVADAVANERDGRLEFVISAAPAPTSPITVTYETRPGTALPGPDYVHKAGTVTLTPAAPSAKVSVSVVKDRILEGYESLSLAMTHHSDGWTFDPAGTGTIIGTGLVETTSTEPMPVTRINSVGIRFTPAGLLVQDWNTRKYFICLNGQSRWKPLGSMDLIKNWYNPEYIPTENPEEIIVAYSDTNFQPWKFHRFNLITNLLVGSGTMPDPTIPGRIIVNDELYMSSIWATGATPPLQLLRSSDSSFVRSLELPPDTDGRPTLKFSTNGTTFMEFFDGWLLHRLAEDGSDLYQRWRGPDPERLVPGSDGMGAIHFNGSFQIVDIQSGAVVQQLDPGDAGTALGDRSLAIVTASKSIRRYIRTPGLPAPVLNRFSIPEDKSSTPITLQFSEAADFPITVKVVRSSSAADFRTHATTVTLAPGQTTVTLPFLVADDFVPETDETQSVVVSLSGDGKTVEYEIFFKIQDNDTLVFDEKTAAKNFLPTSTIDIGEGYPLFTVTENGVLADPTTKTVFTPAPPSDREHFAHTLEGDARYAIAGSPGVSGGSGNAVYIYDRKKKSQVKRIFHTGAGSGFGAVLHLEGDRLLVGAPGLKSAGFVNSYTVPGGVLERKFTQPGKGKGKGANGFGTAITADKGSAWIGAPKSGSGSVYQFSVKTGKLLREFKSPVKGTANFGQSVALCGSYLAIGAPSADASSSVFIYQIKTGKYVGRIITPFANGGYFGASLATLSGKRLVIGCPDPDPDVSRLGSLHVHDLTSKAFRMIVMLKPASKGPGMRRWGTVGVAGAVSGHGNFLAIQYTVGNGKKPSPLCVYDGTSPSKYEGLKFRPVYSLVIAVLGNKEPAKQSFPDLAQFSPAVTATAPPETEAPAAVPAGSNIQVSLNAGQVLVTLPDPYEFPGLTRLVLERSDDLITWENIAQAGGEVPSDWMPLHADALMEEGSRGVRIVPLASGKGFFRVRTEAVLPP